MMNSIQAEPIELCFSARYHEVDQRGMVRIPVVMTWLQDAGIAHAKEMGVSVEELSARGLSWVLSRLTLQVERYPRCYEPIVVSTWPVTRQGLFSIRDYYLTDVEKAIIGRATTSWAVLNMETRRPVRIEDHLPSYGLMNERAINDPFSTLPVLEGACANLIELPVLRADLDQNRHVNNTVYAGWALEATPDETAENCVISSIEIGFRSEGVYGEIIRSGCLLLQDSPCTMIHRIESSSDGRELCRLRTIWKRFGCTLS